MEQSDRGVNRDGAGQGLEQATILIVRYMSDRSALNLTASSVLDTLHEGPIRVTTLAAMTVGREMRSGDGRVAKVGTVGGLGSGGVAPPVR
jgi:hypothetical protein